MIISTECGSFREIHMVTKNVLMHVRTAHYESRLFYVAQPKRGWASSAVLTAGTLKPGYAHGNLPAEARVVKVLSDSGSEGVCFLLPGDAGYSLLVSPEVSGRPVWALDATV